MSVQSAVSDTCMFLLGTCIGITVNYVFSEYENRLRVVSRPKIFALGLFQILFNAIIIRYIRDRINHIGLFTLGLISSQTLIIKKCYQ